MDSLDEFCKTVGTQLNLPTEDVKQCYRALWKIIHDSITSVDLTGDEILSEDKFNKLNLNFNISSIGKLYLTYDKYLRIKSKYKDAKDKES